MSVIQFRVIGTPQSGGSKNSFPIRVAGELTGRRTVTDSNRKARDWMALVIAAAMDAINGQQTLPFNGPLQVEITFFIARPQGHYGTGRNHGQIRAGAPKHPTVRPDVSKLARPTIDALTGVLWRDDSQIVRETHIKQYETPVGCWISVTELPR